VSASACSGCDRRRVRLGLPPDHHLDARHLAPAHPRPALRGRANCPEGQRGRSRRGREKAARRCGARRAAAGHLAASREHPNGLRGRPHFQGGRNAGRGQHQSSAADLRCYPGSRGATSVRQARAGRCEGPPGDRQVQAGDLAPAFLPAGQGRRPVRRVRHRSERTDRHQGALGHLDLEQRGADPVASWGPPQDCPGRAAREAGSVCRSSATGGRGSREVVGSVCRSSARQRHRGFAGLALERAHDQTPGRALPARVARRGLPSLAAREA